MQLDQTTVPLLPRRAFGCIDVAVRFYGRHLQRLLEIWVLVALPCAVLTYMLTVRSSADVRLTLLILYVGTWVAGVLIVSGASRALFGEPFVPTPTTERTLSFTRLLQIVTDVAVVGVALVVVGDIAADVLGADFFYGNVEFIWYALLFILLTLRLVIVLLIRGSVTPGFWPALLRTGIRRAVIIIGPLFLLFPMGTFSVLFGVILSLFMVVVFLRTSFIPESRIMASLDEQLRGQGLKELLKKEGGDLFVRTFIIVTFCIMLSFIIFFTIDRACEVLLGYPILIGRIGPFPGMNWFAVVVEFIRQAFIMLTGDPRCLAVFSASVMLVYPIARLAWFFCYIDLRVRRDCWDMELMFRQEARRLEETA